MDLDHGLDDLSDDLIDSCDIDMEAEQLPEEEEDLFVLFAEALDPETAVTVEEVAELWRQQ